MRARSVTERISWVGGVDWDRRLFDSLVPIPEGTSYNAYVVQGSDATVLIDTVEPSFRSTLFARLDSLGVDRVDYVVSNHAEQDHSGCIPDVLERYPDAKVLCTPKAEQMLLDLIPLDPASIRTVGDGEALDLGDRTLEFHRFPWVHWPETMVTWCPEDRVLFSCDLFGSHLATNALFAPDVPAAIASAKLYYAHIMMPYRKFIERRLHHIAALEPAIIAPSHGPLFDEPGAIMDAYADWVSPSVRNKVTLPFISMHASTRHMVDHLIEALTERGVLVERFNLDDPENGRLAVSLVDSATLVVGTPTVLGSAHPNALYAANLAGLLKPKVRHAAVIGSYGWGSMAPKHILAALTKLKLEDLGSVQAKGRPDASTRDELDALADAIAARHAEL